MGRIRHRVQCSSASRPSLPVVQSWYEWIRDRVYSDMHPAARRRIDAMELGRPDLSSCGDVSISRVGNRTYVWLDRLVLGTLELALPSYFRHTEKT